MLYSHKVICLDQFLFDSAVSSATLCAARLHNDCSLLAGNADAWTDSTTPSLSLWMETLPRPRCEPGKLATASTTCAGAANVHAHICSMPAGCDESIVCMLTAEAETAFDRQSKQVVRRQPASMCFPSVESDDSP